MDMYVKRTRRSLSLKLNTSLRSNDAPILEGISNNNVNINMDTAKKPVQNVESFENDFTGFGTKDIEEARSRTYTNSVKSGESSENGFIGFDTKVIEEAKKSLSQLKVVTKKLTKNKRKLNSKSLKAKENRLTNFGDDNKPTPKRVNKRKRDVTSSSFSPEKEMHKNNVLSSVISKTVEANDSLKLKEQLPVYVAKKFTPLDSSLLSEEERLSLYDFDIDENEPKVKKSRRKPILKMIKRRASRKSLKNDNTFVKKSTFLSPDIELRSAMVAKSIIESDHEDKENKSLVNAVKSNKQSTPSNVPILCINSANKVLTSDAAKMVKPVKYFRNLFMGSSTPIREGTDNVSINNQLEDINKSTAVFDVSNCFGFDEHDCIEEPLVSPIKANQTPSRFLSLSLSRKSLPNRPSAQHDIRMLKTGGNTMKDEENNLEDEMMKSVIFQDHDSSLTEDETVPTPQIASKLEKSDSSREKEGGGFSLSPTEGSAPLWKESLIKSYERPRKIRRLYTDHESHSEQEEDEHEEAEAVSKVQKGERKRPALSKKEEKELETWADSFNQSCMEIDGHSLCVE